MNRTQEQRRFDGVTCPDCDGPIFEGKEGSLRFSCAVGHSYAPESMRLAHAKRLENALWSAIAMFEEHATLLRRIAGNEKPHGAELDVDDLEKEALEEEEYAAELRAFVEKMCGKQSLQLPSWQRREPA